jgi:hypothetical protein
LVIDAFFVRTADNSVRHHGRFSSGRIDEREHFFCYAAVIADIGPFGEPALKICGLGMLRWNDADRELGCRPIVRAVESDGSYGVAAKSSLSSLAEPLACTLNHLFVAAPRQLLEAWGDRVEIFYRSRTVPRLLAWSEPSVSQPLACVLAIS